MGYPWASGAPIWPISTYDIFGKGHVFEGLGHLFLLDFTLWGGLDQRFDHGNLLANPEDDVLDA